jgi:hypothetical protein
MFPAIACVKRVVIALADRQEVITTAMIDYERIQGIAMGKRANTEGSIYQRKDGRWVASISLDNGKRKSVYCKKQREAIKAVQQANRAKEEGLFVSEEQTVGEFLTSWLRDTIQHSVRLRTYIRYRQLIEQHVLPTLAKIKLQKLSAQHLQALYNAKLEEGYAPQTVKHIHRVLHGRSTTRSGGTWSPGTSVRRPGHHGCQSRKCGPSPVSKHSASSQRREKTRWRRSTCSL